MEIQRREDLLLVVPLQLAVEHLLDRLLSLDCPWDVVHVLGLDERLEVVLEHLGEVVLQLRASEVLENVLPVRWLLCRRSALVSTTKRGGLTSNRPRFGLSLPERILSAVLLPIPFVPTRPRTWPGRGVGRRCSLNELAE